MNNERVGSFVSDLVEMAKAVERVPELEHELDMRAKEIAKLDFINIDLELSLEASRCYAASLEQRCHDLEVSRDAAELRFLESDDAKGTIERSMRALRGEIDSVLQAIAPIEVIPEPAPFDFPLVDGPLAPQGEVSEVPVDPTVPSDPMNPSTVSSETVASPESAPQEPVASHVEEAPADATLDPQPPTASSFPMPSSPSAPPVETSASAASDSDLEPMKYDYYGEMRSAWLEWFDRQQGKLSA